MSGNLREPRAVAQSVAALLAVVAALSPLAAGSTSASDETTTLARFRRVTQATLAYATDNDNVLPLAMSYDTNGRRWRVSTFTAVPAGWTKSGGRDAWPRRVEERSMVLNAILGHGASGRDFEAAGMPEFNPGHEQADGGERPFKVSVAYNGDLHAWPVDGVVTPSRLPLFTQGFKQNTVGSSLSFPALCCTAPGPACRFDPRGYPQSVANCAYTGVGYGDVWFMSTAAKNWSVWAYGHRLVFARVDGSVESREIELPTWPDVSLSPNDSPWSSFDRAMVGGAPYWINVCVGPGQVKGPGKVLYMAYYRPDSEFSYRPEQCDFGGGGTE